MGNDVGLDFGFLDEGNAGDEPGSAVVAVNLDLTEAKKRFEGYRAKIKELKAEVEKYKIESDDDAAALTALLGTVATFRSNVEDTRKAEIKEADTYVRGVNSFVKSFRDDLDAITRNGKQKIGQFSYQKELERREEQKKLELARVEEQRRLDAMAKEKDVAPVVVPKMVAPVKTAPIRTETGKSATAFEWTWKLTNLSELPREYMRENPAALDQAVKAGIRKIPGVTIYEKPKVRISRG